jgi:hypothetical protein
MKCETHKQTNDDTGTGMYRHQGLSSMETTSAKYLVPSTWSYGTKVESALASGGHNHHAAMRSVNAHVTQHLRRTKTYKDTGQLSLSR